MGYQNIKVAPNAGVGAFVEGVDLSDFDEQTLAELRHAFAEHSILFFRNQQLSEQQHIALAERWGDINVNRFFAHVEGFPQIAQVLKEPDQVDNIGGGWHTDHSYDQIPALGSMLYARETPPRGGDTLFASTCAAYDALSDGLKQTLHFERWTAEESQPLLSYLYQHISRPECCFRLQWAPGTLAFWDNRATWHWAINDYQGERRLMHRITLEGEPIAA